jgi:ABC-type transport system involved in multi-copper enzyme maturation permease subunit
MIDTLRAEHTKLRSLGGVRWLLLATAAALVVVGAALAATVDADRCASEAGCSLDPVKTSLGGVWIAQIAVCVLGVLAVSTEYDTAQIGVTLAAMPRRLAVLVAKTAAVVSLVVGAAAVGTLGALVAGRAVLGPGGVAIAPPGAGPVRPSLTDALTARAGVGTTLYLALVAVLAVGIAAVLREAASAIVTVLGLLFLFPLLGLVITDPVWQQRLHRYAPMDAGLTVQATRDLDRLAVGPWSGLGVLAAYSLAALGVGAVLFMRRDP